MTEVLGGGPPAGRQGPTQRHVAGGWLCSGRKPCLRDATRAPPPPPAPPLQVYDGKVYDLLRAAAGQPRGAQQQQQHLQIQAVNHVACVPGLLQVRRRAPICCRGREPTLVACITGQTTHATVCRPPCWQAVLSGPTDDAPCSPHPHGVQPPHLRCSAHDGLVPDPCCCLTVPLPPAIAASPPLPYPPPAVLVPQR